MTSVSITADRPSNHLDQFGRVLDYLYLALGIILTYMCLSCAQRNDINTELNVIGLPVGSKIVEFARDGG